MDGAKDKILSLSKTNWIKGYSKTTHVKNTHGSVKKTRNLNIQKQSEDKIIENIRNLHEAKKKIKQLNTK